MVLLLLPWSTERLKGMVVLRPMRRRIDFLPKPVSNASRPSQDDHTLLWFNEPSYLTFQRYEHIKLDTSKKSNTSRILQR